MDPPVSVPRTSPRQPSDLSKQRRLVAPLPPAISPIRPRPPHDAAGPPLRDAVALAQVIRRGPLPVGGHHFFSRVAKLTGGTVAPTSQGRRPGHGGIAAASVAIRAAPPAPLAVPSSPRHSPAPTPGPPPAAVASPIPRSPAPSPSPPSPARPDADR